MTEPNILDGKWQIIKALEGGREVMQGDAHLHIEGDHFKRVTSEHIYERRMILDWQSSPKTIDLHILNNPQKGKILEGIFKLEEDTLSICHAMPGHPRPDVFTSSLENGNVLSISKKYTSEADL